MIVVMLTPGGALQGVQYTADGRRLDIWWSVARRAAPRWWISLCLHLVKRYKMYVTPLEVIVVLTPGRALQLVRHPARGYRRLDTW